MLKRMSCLLFIGLTCSAVVAQVSQYVTYQHNPFYNDPLDPSLPNLYYYEIDASGGVTIHHGVAGEVFELEAVVWNDGTYVRPGNISLITADADAGPVAITVVGNINAQHGQPYGARSIMALTLNAPGVEGVVAGLRISSMLGSTADTYMGTLAGECEVLGIGRPLHITALTGSFNSPQSTLPHPVFIGTLAGMFSAHGVDAVTMDTLSATGTFDVGPNTSYVINGAVTVGVLEGLFIGGEVRAPMQIGALNGGTVSVVALDEEEPEADITISGAGPHSGYIHLWNPLEEPHNSLTINGDFDGSIVAGGCTQCMMFGSISVTGDVSSITLPGYVGSTGVVDIGGDLLGRLRIGNTMAGQIHVAGGLLADGRIDIAEDLHELGTLRIDGNVSADANGLPRVRIGDEDATYGNVAGRLALGRRERTMEGTCAIKGAVTDGASVEVNGEIGAAGSIAIGADMAGTLTVTGRVRGEITIGGAVPAHAALTLGGLDGELSIASDVAGGLSVTGGVAAGLGATPRVRIGDDDPADVADLMGDASIAGGLSGGLWIEGDITPSGALEIEGGLAADGRVGMGGDLGGTLHIVGDVASGSESRIRIGDNVRLSGSLVVAGTLRGGIEIGNDIVGGGFGNGQVQVNGDIANGGYVTVGGHMRGVLATTANGGVRGDLAGYMHIGGDLSGQIDIAGCLGDREAPTDFAGHIRVLGGFKSAGVGEADDPTLVPPPQIYVHLRYDREGGEAIGPTSYIAIDYDGYGDGDRWEEGAVVILVDPHDPCKGNSPARRIWATTYPRGDMNNNAPAGAQFPGFDDINAFVLALTDPRAYALQFPGLAETDVTGQQFVSGSVLYHGDCNCDGVFDFGDINAFVALLSGVVDPNCVPETRPSAAAQVGTLEPGAHALSGPAGLTE